MMRKWFMLPLALLLFRSASAEELVIRVVTEEQAHLTDICYQVDMGDQYISADNQLYEIIRVERNTAIAQAKGAVTMPDITWLDVDAAVPVTTMTRRIALYCTHSDESYEPSDGTYTNSDRGTIYEVAQELADALSSRNIDTTVAQTLHHPHDAGAYRRSRQTAVSLIRNAAPDCLLDIHRDGIPDPGSYTVTLGGQKASKIRLLVGRGNQNAEINKEFALLIKAVGDKVYPGLIKDIYLGKGAFNQDLLPRALLLECGTYTLEKERVLRSMPLMADVITRALYGGIVGSAGRNVSDTAPSPDATAPVTMGQEDLPAQPEPYSIGSGFIFLGGLLVIGVVVVAFLSTGSRRAGSGKLGRNLSEMTGGLLGKKPKDDEDPHHST